MTDDENKPTPDPTILTTEQLLREITTLKEFFQASLDGFEAVSLVKFTSVETQLGLVERQRVEQKKDTKDAVDAALAAAKEAVKEQTTASQLSIGKSEGSTKEQLGQLSTTFTTAQQAMTQALAVLTTRVERIENARTTLAEQRVEQRGITGTSLAAIGVALTVIAIAAPIIITLALR